MSNLEDRFWNKVNKKSDCWNWIGSISKLGYGCFNNNGKPVLAHRFSYELVNGKIENKLTIDHLCRNRSCVNPKHLEKVTQKENVLRGECNAAKNARKTHCIHGHEFKGSNIITRKDGRECRECKRASKRTEETKAYKRLLYLIKKGKVK